MAMASMGNGYVGTAQDAAGIRRLEKQREAECKRIRDLKKKTAKGPGGRSCSLAPAIPFGKLMKRLQAPLRIIKNSSSQGSQTYRDWQTERSLGSVTVIGAGISGLAAAYRLRSKGVALTVFEAQDAVGGKIQSYSKDGLIWEKGPNTMIEIEPEVTSLLDQLGLIDKQQWIWSLGFKVFSTTLHFIHHG